MKLPIFCVMSSDSPKMCTIFIIKTFNWLIQFILYIFHCSVNDSTLEVKTLRMIKVDHGYKIGQEDSMEKIS